MSEWSDDMWDAEASRFTQLNDGDYFIDSRGQVVKFVVTHNVHWGNSTRCRKCCYFSKVGHYLGTGYCKVARGNVHIQGIETHYPLCSRGKFVEVNSEQS